MVVLNSALFIFFAFTFFKPQSGRDWRSFGAFSAFLVALFTEMYVFPLTIYLLLPWLQSHYPGINWLTHDAGHLLEEMVGWRGNPHFGPLHLLSDVFICGGFWLLSASWPPRYQAQRHKQVAISGPYDRIRHPQYVAFVAVMVGFLLQWPTLLTVGMFPILVFMYGRLAKTEKRDSLATFGDSYAAYLRATPAFIPRLGGGPGAHTPFSSPHRLRFPDRGDFGQAVSLVRVESDLLTDLEVFEERGWGSLEAHGHRWPSERGDRLMLDGDRASLRVDLCDHAGPLAGLGDGCWHVRNGLSGGGFGGGKG